MTILKNSIDDKKEFVTEIYMDGHGDDAVIIEVAPTEKESIDAALFAAAEDFTKIARIETWSIPQHYTADELA